LKRRAFLLESAVGGASLLGLGELRAETSTAVAQQGEGVASFELEEATIAEVQRDMVGGKLTSLSLTRQYLERIDDMDRKGPALRAMLEINPDAQAIARDLDAERRARGSRGPLHGIPVLLKDNIDTNDRMTTTAGSYALEGSIPLRDAFIAQRLRDAGAVLLGKTNLSEWANFRSSKSSSGWSGRGGQARNPYILDRNPCGSSSGSGSAISANFAMVSVGTETDGSIVCPASASGIVGIKPTLGLVSRAGIIPIAHSQDTAGPMARTVTDAAILLTALAGIDPRDSATKTSRGRSRPDYTRFLDANGLKGARIGVARERFFGYSEETDRIAEDAISEMRRRGAVIVDPANIASVGKFDDTEFEVLLYEFKADLNAYLAGLTESPVRSLADVMRFNATHQDREMPYFRQEIMEMAQKKGALTTAAGVELPPV